MNENEQLNRQAAQNIEQAFYRHAMGAISAGSGDLRTLAILAVAHELTELRQAIEGATPKNKPRRANGKSHK